MYLLTKLIMKKNIYCVLMLLCSMCTGLWAQGKQVDSIAPLYVGAKLPRTLFTLESKVLKGRQLSATSLSGDFNKLIIIDFWASWCGSCLKKFPLLEKMQEKYPDDLKVLLVNSLGTGDTAASLIAKAGPDGALAEMSLPFVVEDELFLKAFPHRSIPHYVWIIGGEIEGITSSDFLTEENVVMMVERNRKHVLTVSKLKRFREPKY
ncbi:TlpA family protein disulfide reductase [Pedobacter kyonggii]|uniref:TlpA family protein disulfide reductase n=2 Tax=Pedobacter kyonggii TaxID=1926871 RepID=A0A4Q9HCY8_9SPHI|nr:TlpA family protein disulfide reductase [Pedobacter kyonggii]